MNCCDDAGRCTNGKNGSPCACRATLNRHPFAPGAIKHHVRPVLGSRAHRRELKRWVGNLILAITLCAAAACGGLLAAIAIRFFGGA